ncbi:MAG: glycosyltransferase [Leptolyngbya sp. SIOISBB]|nr:glycosyltransferase [Leptolyngbya sp. SIOISBB]
MSEVNSPPAAIPEMVHVGIVLATYNCDRAHFAAQIHSIQHQDFQRWRCLITDDGSKPEIQQYMADLIADDPRFIVQIQPQNLGSYHNFESGLNFFRQDEAITHIAFADQDDVWQPQKLTHLLRAMIRSDALLAHSDLSLIDDQGQTLHPSVWQYEQRHPEQLDAELLLLRNTVTGCSTIIARQLLEAALPFPPQQKTGDWYHDHWLAIVAAHKGCIAHVREPLVQYRQHGENVVGAEKQAGSVRTEIVLWLQKKGRLTLQSYRIHRDLSQAFFQRFYPLETIDQRNPFAAKRLDFGWAILRLGLRSLWCGYGSQGITLRLWLNKFIFDCRRVGQWFSPRSRRQDVP